MTFLCQKCYDKRPEQWRSQAHLHHEAQAASCDDCGVYFAQIMAYVNVRPTPTTIAEQERDEKLNAPDFVVTEIPKPPSYKDMPTVELVAKMRSGLSGGSIAIEMPIEAIARILEAVTEQKHGDVVAASELRESLRRPPRVYTSTEIAECRDCGAMGDLLKRIWVQWADLLHEAGTPTAQEQFRKMDALMEEVPDVCGWVIDPGPIPPPAEMMAVAGREGV